MRLWPWGKKEDEPIKKEIRILGIDDAPFSKTKKGSVLVVGSIFRGGKSMEGVISTHVTVDGNDSTEKLIQLINGTKHKDQLQVVLTDGIALGGFNVIDIDLLNKRTGLPVIVIMRNYPDLDKVKEAVKHVDGWKLRWKLIKAAGEIYEIDVKKSKIYCQLAGIRADRARELVKLCVVNGTMPEPIRASHIISSGIVEGESRGRA